MCVNAVALHFGDVAYISDFENCKQKYLGYKDNKMYGTDDCLDENIIFEKVNLFEDLIQSNCLLHYPVPDINSYGWKYIKQRDAN